MHFRLTRYIILLVLMLVPSIGQANLTSPSAANKKLKETRQTIHKIQSHLKKTHQRENKATQQLKQLEKKIATLHRNRQKLSKQLQQQKFEWTQLSKQEQLLHIENKQAQRQLSQWIQDAQYLSRQSPIKSLLELKSLNEFNRLMQYHQYFQKNVLLQCQEQFKHLETVKAAKIHAEQSKQKLEKTEQQLKQSLQALHTSKKKRRELITKLQDKKQKQQQQLQNLARDEALLQEKLQALLQALSEVPLYPQTTPFGALKGKLQPPVSTISAQERQTLNTARQIFTSPIGQPVHTIYRGRVIYADWLRGFGLLTIVDHGQGYMSLYGHAQQLFTKLGDWVDTGELIAKVGESGGQLQGGLYFEIRKHGQPINLAGWFNSKSG